MRDDLIAALHQIEDFPGASMCEIKGIRRGVHQCVKDRRELLTVDFPTFIRIEIICTDAMAPTLAETIRSTVRTGKPGDGKIFVSPVESCLSISDGKTGEGTL